MSRRNVELILATVGATYLKLRERTASDITAPPPLLDKGTESQANGWTYTLSAGDHPRYTVRAKSIRQIQEPSLMELNIVELQLFHANGKDYDLVKCDRAEFDMATRLQLYDVPSSLGRRRVRAPRMPNSHYSHLVF